MNLFISPTHRNTVSLPAADADRPTQNTNSSLTIQVPIEKNMQKAEVPWSPLLDPPESEATRATARAAAGHVDTTAESQGQTDIFTIMRLTFELGLSMREADQEAQLAFLEIHVQKMGDVSEKIREAAKKAFWAGVAMGSASIVAGAMTVGSSLKSLSAMKSSRGQFEGAKQSVKQSQSSVNTAQKQLATAQTELADAGHSATRRAAAERLVQAKRTQLAEARSNLAQSEQNLELVKVDLDLTLRGIETKENLVKGMNSGFQGGAKLTEAFLNQSAEVKRAEQQEAKTEADTTQVHMNHWSEARREQHEVNRSVIDALKAVAAAERETSRTIFSI